MARTRQYVTIRFTYDEMTEPSRWIGARGNRAFNKDSDRVKQLHEAGYFDVEVVTVTRPTEVEDGDD